MKPQVVYAKLKTEIIPVQELLFLETIRDILTRNVSKQTVTKLLSSCFKDNESTIERFVKQEYTANWTKDASELYKILVGDMQIEFQANIVKKFSKKEFEPKKTEVLTSIRGLESKMVKLSDIKIPKNFRDFPPTGYKVGKAWDYFKKYEAFQNHILIDQDNNLKEGYVKYLICKALDISDVLCYNAGSQIPDNHKTSQAK